MANGVKMSSLIPFSAECATHRAIYMTTGLSIFAEEYIRIFFLFVSSSVLHDVHAIIIKWNMSPKSLVCFSLLDAITRNDLWAGVLILCCVPLIENPILHFEIYIHCLCVCMCVCFVHEWRMRHCSRTRPFDVHTGKHKMTYSVSWSTRHGSRSKHGRQTVARPAIIFSFIVHKQTPTSLTPSMTSGARFSSRNKMEHIIIEPARLSFCITKWCEKK